VLLYCQRQAEINFEYEPEIAMVSKEIEGPINMHVILKIERWGSQYNDGVGAQILNFPMTLPDAYHF
jgi:hypothetical protein